LYQVITACVSDVAPESTYSARLLFPGANVINCESLVTYWNIDTPDWVTVKSSPVICIFCPAVRVSPSTLNSIPVVWLSIVNPSPGPVISMSIVAYPFPTLAKSGRSRHSS
jgi:hypothetical protein